MTVASLRDLGVSEAVFQEALRALGTKLPGCRFERGERSGISGWRFLVDGHEGEEETDAGHHHEHDHQGHHHSHSHGHHHPHVHGRNHAEIAALISGSSLAERVKSRALSVFHRIAIAEGAIHGVPPENVGFHEVGAEDSIADIICACAGFEALGAERITCGPLIEGSGHVHCTHGTFPLPAPATLALLKGIPFRQVEEPWEHITPTGAALIAEFATEFGPMPGMTVSSIGYGLGSRQTPNRPNVLRLVLGDAVRSCVTNSDEVLELRCTLDDLTPEHAADALESLMKSGALDVTLTPTVMKKGRSGWILEVLCHPHQSDDLSEKILRRTTAFGIRRHRMERLILERHHRVVETPYGNVSIKVGTLGGDVLQETPEFSSCAEAAARHQVAVREVHVAALRALSEKSQ